MLNLKNDDRPTMPTVRYDDPADKIARDLALRTIMSLYGCAGIESCRSQVGDEILLEVIAKHGVSVLPTEVLQDLASAQKKHLESRRVRLAS